MKRRKKLWIACAALAVVVALCAFALLYRPKPYDFLNGARLVKVSNEVYYANLSSTTVLAPPKTAHTTYRYELEEDFDSATAAARMELTKEGNWEWSAPDGLNMASAINRVRLESVAIYETGRAGQPRVHVTVSKRTSTLDRVVGWLHNR